LERLDDDLLNMLWTEYVGTAVLAKSTEAEVTE
jgi:hypothetical protein